MPANFIAVNGLFAIISLFGACYVAASDSNTQPLAVFAASVAVHACGLFCVERPTFRRVGLALGVVGNVIAFTTWFAGMPLAVAFLGGGLGTLASAAYFVIDRR